MIEVISEKCTGCQLCIKSCAYDAIKIIDGIAEIDTDKCTLCGACVSACPFQAIFIRKAEKEKINKDKFDGIFVFAEKRDGEISPVVYELLGKGRDLSDISETKLTAFIVANQNDTDANNLISSGADQVVFIQNDKLKSYSDELYSNAIVKIVKKYNPEIILAGATVIGRSLMPRIATELHTGLTADCTQLEIDEESNDLYQTRPAFGGNIMATIVTPNHRPQMATVRHKVMDPLKKDVTRKGKVIVENIEVDDIAYSKFIETIKYEETTENIVEADFVVSGGRGLKNKENFKMIEELAKSIDGAVGASRAVIDNEWVSYPHQVGQTGKTIKPKIYIASGISGAIQHLAGMSSSDFIIAINKDADAPIFKVADFGIVGDLFEILPKLTKKLNK
ncbi:MAG: electron transfer flavoprotein subunit alpha [Candidatus Cloacimonadota bacterium]|nr:electron transfer flavoprotein subunit alpha [Candidatus Cloacimonadota bacterium]